MRITKGPAGLLVCEDESGALTFDWGRNGDGQLVVNPLRWSPSPEVYVQIEEVLRDGR